MLIRLRQEGHSYAAIADSIQKEVNVSVTPNALVKRYHKIQELYLEVSSGFVLPWPATPVLRMETREKIDAYA